MLVSSRSLRLLVSVCFYLSLGAAQIQPTAPGPNETYNAGSSCKIAWVPDSSGSWTNMTIDLMSGSNNNMSLVTKVASSLDGTNASLTPFSWTCPEVTPYSAIYFYQFTNGNLTMNSTWTTRFTIASPSGQTESPKFAVQPNGDQIPWGAGVTKSARSPSSQSLSSGNEPMISTSKLSLANAHAEKTESLQVTLALPTETSKHTSSKLHDHHSSENSEGDRSSKHQKTRLTDEASESSRHSSERKEDTSPTETEWAGLAEASPSGDCHCYNEENGALSTVPELSLFISVALCTILMTAF